MIEEITNFVDELSPDVFVKDRELNKGLYLLLDIDSNGNLLNIDNNGYLKSDDIIIHKKNDELNPKKYHLLQWQINATPVHHQKTLDNNKKIFNKICSHLAIGFKKEIFSKYIKREEYSVIEDSFGLYFRKASEYLENVSEKMEMLKTFCERHLIDFVINLDEYIKLNQTDVVYLLLKDFKISDQKEFYELYLSDKVYNDNKLNKHIDGDAFGIPNSLSGFNRKKLFLKHQTAPLELNFLVPEKQAIMLWQFFRLKKSNKIPNPFPLFIDKKELSEGVVSVFNENRTLGYAEIIKNLVNNYDEEYLSNYYLIFFRGTEIIDLDFVSAFQYRMDQDLRVREAFPLGGKQTTRIENVFELEKKVINKIFNGQLIRSSKWLKYFDDVDYDPKYFTLNGYNKFLKYRKAFYDYIYKSNKQAVTQRMFEDLIINGILDDIRRDKIKYDKETSIRYHSKQNRIKEKLNIWFSLYNFFDSNNQNSIDMIKTTKELKESLLTIAKDETGQISTVSAENDRLFAFAAGQVIYKILIQSKSSNRSHALLEPFLQKKDPALFKDAIAKAFDRYKHEFTLYPKKYEFDRVMGEVMGYSPEEKNMKNLLPDILAGYFTESIFKHKNNEE